MKLLDEQEIESVAQPLIELGRQHPATLALIKLMEAQWFACNDDTLAAGVQSEKLHFCAGYQAHCQKVLETLESLYQKREARFRGEEEPQ